MHGFGDFRGHTSCKVSQVVGQCQEHNQNHRDDDSGLAQEQKPTIGIVWRSPQILVICGSTLRGCRAKTEQSW